MGTYIIISGKLCMKWDATIRRGTAARNHETREEAGSSQKSEENGESTRGTNGQRKRTENGKEMDSMQKFPRTGTPSQ